MGSRFVSFAGFARLGLGLACALSVVLAPLSCEQSSTEESHADTSVVKLEPAQRLVRISMALRGTRPASEELEAVRRDSNALPGIVDGYLRGEGFAEMIRDLHDQALDVAVPAAIYPAGFAAVGPLAGQDVQRINVSLTEAPLRLIEHVVVEDRPYTEIITADYTLADGAVATVWGLQYGGTGRSWEVTHWADGRPSAGILSDSMLFTRHSTTFSNKNRGRANAVARALLCYDFIDRQIEIDANIDLSNPDEVANAIQNNATCASCHQTLDPLAAYFAKYQPLFVPSQVDGYPVPFYTPELTRVFSVRDAGYFGFPGSDVAHLGQMMAQDPRFSLCAARRFYAYFHQIPAADVPPERAAQLQSVLVRNWNAKDLIRSIVLADDFAVSHVDIDDPQLDRHALFKARPWQLARLIADLTGFRWEMDFDFDIGWGRIGHVDLMTDAFLGFEVLSGGIDGVNVTLPSHTMNASSSIVLDALAAQAAEQVVENDFQWMDSRKLLTRIALEDTSEGAVREQLVELQGRLFGTLAAADSADTTRAWQLFQAALGEASGDAQRAWKSVLYAMLQDPKVVYY